MNAGRLRATDHYDLANGLPSSMSTSGARFRILSVGNKRLAQSVVQGQRRESKQNSQNRIILIQISQHHHRQMIVGKVRHIRTQTLQAVTNSSTMAYEFVPVHRAYKHPQPVRIVFYIWSILEPRSLV